MRNLTILVLLAIVLVILAGCSQTVPGETTGDGTNGAAPGPQISLDHTALQEFGPEGAKVEISAYFPLDEKHQKIIEWLKGFVDKYPDKVKLTVWDFRTDEGAVATKEAFGKICGGMQVNGVSDFEIVINGKKSEVTIMNGENVYWTKPEMEAVIAQTVMEVYEGAPAEEEEAVEQAPEEE